MQIPDDVKQRWVAKTDALPDVALPYASATSLSIAGHNPDRHMALALTRLIRLFPNEVPLDGGPARCKQWDRALYDKHVNHLGRGPRGFTAMEAVWLATDEAFWYITPQVGFYRLEWNHITITPLRQGRKFSRVLISTAGDNHELRLSTPATANLFAIQSWAESSK